LIFDFIFFPSHQVIFILVIQSGQPGYRAVSLGMWRACRDGANLGTSFQQILGMESEILWESEITPTLAELEGERKICHNSN
jgi:hypothetical protein